MHFLQNVENLSPQIIRRVAKEMAELTAQTPEGIRVILNEADVTDIQAVIEGPGKIDRSLLDCAYLINETNISKQSIFLLTIL